MHRLIYLPIFIFLSFPTSTPAEDTTAKQDSFSVVANDVSVDSGAQDTTGAAADDTGRDSSVTTGRDSVLSSTSGDTQYVGSDSGSVDSIREGYLQDTFTTDETISTESAAPDTTGLQKKAIQKIRSELKNIFRLSLRYFKHFLILIISCGVIVFTVFFYRKKNDNKRFMTSTRLSVMDKEVQRACRYMENHYADPDLSVESLCEALVTGPAFLEALFDRELGMNVSDFLTQVRINRAKIISKKLPEITVDEIISHIGFSDNALFLQKFNEIVGVTFEEYQESLHQKKSE